MSACCKPIVREEGRVIDCTCEMPGYVQEGIYNEPIGAREAYLHHVALATILRAGWPGAADVDYRETEIPAAERVLR